MSQTASQQCLTPTFTFDEQSYRHYAHWFQEGFITIGILGPLYGVLAILSAVSVYALLMRRSDGRRIPPNSIVLSLTVLAVFTSTTLYVVSCVVYYQYDFLDLFLRSRDLLWSGPTSVHFDGGPEYIGRNIPKLQACLGSTTVTVNVILGDAIVWWRTCIIWRNSRVVKAIGGLFLLSTFVLGVVDCSNSCQSSHGGWYDFIDKPGSNVPGSLFEGLPIGTAACVLSLCTNLVATLLVAYKAWRSRRLLKGYLMARVGGSQMEKLFALLIESGAIYSAIWAVVVAYQIASNDAPPPESEGSLSPTESKFLDVFGVIMNGALVPAIAIYPTVIIVLVALNRSHMERGLTQHLESLPTPRLSLTVSTRTGKSHEGCTRERSDVLPAVNVIGEQLEGCGCGGGSELEGVSKRASEERKLTYTSLASGANADGSQ